MLTDTHYAVLDLVKAGQPLLTKRVHGKAIAKIGPETIPVKVVTDLEKTGLIRCWRVDNHGALHGKTRHYEAMAESR
jgi:hypothetical protein